MVPKNNNEGKNELSAKEIYSDLVQLVKHSELLRWNRFHNYLMINSILVVAWAIIYVSEQCSPIKIFVLIGICILGGISGIVWSGLGYRSCKFHNRFLKMAKELENKHITFPKKLNEKYKIMNETDEMRESLKYKIFSSWNILRIGPCCFTVFYILLLFVNLPTVM